MWLIPDSVVQCEGVCQLECVHPVTTVILIFLADEEQLLTGMYTAH